MLVLAGSVIAQSPASPASTPLPSAAEEARFQQLLAQYDSAGNSSVRLSDAERMQFIGRVSRQRSDLALQFLALAEEHPGEPVALEALMRAAWQVNTTPWPVELVGDDPARARALQLIARDHLASARLGPLCERVSVGFAQEYEVFLRATAGQSPISQVRDTATLCLGWFLNNRSQRIALCRQQPALAEQFADLFGQPYLLALMQQNRDEVEREIEALFERASAADDQLTLQRGDGVAERARAALFAARHLSVGKLAPEIEGVDQHGERLTLSEHLGRVVLLIFWSDL